MEQKSYYAIIPANVRYDKELTANAKLMYGEITSLCNEKGFCWAENRYFAELYQVSEVSISKWINQLVKKGYIESVIEYKEGTKQILHRYLTILKYPIKENFNTPIKENFKDNIQDINNKTNNKEKSKKETDFDKIINSYTENNDLKKELIEFIKMRKVLKKPLTNYALELRIKRLDKLAKNDNDKILIVQQSIASGYQDFYPLKQDFKKKEEKKGFQNRQYTKEEYNNLFSSIEELDNLS